MSVYDEDLKQRWFDLTSWMAAEVRERWWERIHAAYTEPHRHYHNTKHLYQVMHHYDHHKDSLSNRYAVAYALFFHDIVYDPKATDNEAKSAALFKQFSKETTIDQASYIVDLIENTTTHCTDAHMHNDQCGADDVHYFLDFDMAVLGLEPAEYDEYKNQIRQEYSHLDNTAYKEGRSKILRLFLQIPNIYATHIFRQRFEAKARVNIQREIDELSQA